MPRPVDHVVDANGDVWADRCTCPQHDGPLSLKRGHDAEPRANLIRNPRAVLELGLGPARQYRETA